jgi:hypothetical protein
MAWKPHLYQDLPAPIARLCQIAPVHCIDLTRRQRSESELDSPFSTVTKLLSANREFVRVVATKA